MRHEGDRRQSPNSLFCLDRAFYPVFIVRLLCCLPPASLILSVRTRRIAADEHCRRYAAGRTRFAPRPPDRERPRPARAVAGERRPRPRRAAVEAAAGEGGAARP